MVRQPGGKGSLSHRMFVALVVACTSVAVVVTVAASLILSLEGVFGVAFSMIFYHERLTLQVGLGFLVIFAGILLSEVLPEVLKARREAYFPSLRPRKRREEYIRIRR